MKEKKFFSEHAVHLASLFAVLALIMFIPAGISKSIGVRVCFIVLMILFMIAGIVILYLSHRAKGSRLHYFLYDRRRQAILPKSELTAERIREGVDLYLSEYTESATALWQDIPKKLRIQLEQDTSFRPLIAYRMLLDLSTKESDETLSIFLGADDRAVGYICRAIRDSGDADMADYIFELKKSKDRSHTPAFFRKNRHCFEERMLRFVERHMSDFYMDKIRVDKT